MFIKTKKVFRLMAVAATLVIMAGCASSPQFVTIRPNIDLGAERIGNGNAVEVVVQDNRAGSVIGYRGGVYENSGQISAGNDIQEAIGQAVRARLAAQGFAVNVAPGSNAARLTVYLDALNYTNRAEALKNDVSVEAKLSAEVNAGTETYTGRFQTKESKVFVTKPDTLDNEAIINLAISNTINRIFEDPKIRMMLQSSY